MSEGKQIGSGGAGALSLIGVGFVLGKVFGVAPVADWSWWYVLAPFWVPWIVVAALITVLGLSIIIAKALDWAISRRMGR